MLASFGMSGFDIAAFLVAALFVSGIIVVVLVASIIGRFHLVIDCLSPKKSEGDLRSTLRLILAKRVSHMLFGVGAVAMIISRFHGWTLGPTWLNRNSQALGFTGLAYFVTAVALRIVARKMARREWAMREVASWGVFLIGGILASAMCTLYLPLFRPRGWLSVHGLEFGSLFILTFGFTVAVLVVWGCAAFRPTERTILPRVAAGVLLTLGSLDALLWAVVVAMMNERWLCRDPDSTICLLARSVADVARALFLWVLEVR